MANYFEQFHTEAPQAPAPPANYFAQFHPADKALPTATAPSVPLGLAKASGVGLGEGLISGAGAIGDVRSALSSGVDFLGRKLGVSPETVQAGKQTFSNIFPGGKLVASAPTSEELKSKVEGVTGPFYQPQTVPEEYARTIGQFVPTALGGAGGIASRVAQVAVPALASETLGQVYKGTEAEPYARAIGAVGGGLAVPGLAAAGRRAVTPFPISQERQTALNVLRNEGVDVPAGMATGNRQLNAAQSQLGGVQYQANLERAKEQYTAAALRRAGINAQRATPDVLDAADVRIGGVFDSVAARNPTIPVPGFAKVAQTVADHYATLPVQPSPYFNNLIAKVGGVLSGEQYQALQSEMRRLRASSSVPEFRNALDDMKQALDVAIQAGLKNPGDAQLWKQARREWAGFKTVEKAVSGTTQDAAAGLITPVQLSQAIKSGSTAAKANVARERGPFGQLARAGNLVMREFPDSGTASRAAAIAKAGIAGAGATGALSIPAAVASYLAPWLAGRALTSRLGQQYLTNQRLGPGAGFRPGAFLPPVFAAPSQLRRPEEQ